MSEAVYFVVTKRHGVERFATYRDHLPRWMMGKRAKAEGLVYKIRLDTLGRGAELVDLSLQQLCEQYVVLKAAGKLPPDNTIPPPLPPGEKGTLREHWQPLPATWDQKAPAKLPWDKGVE